VSGLLTREEARGYIASSPFRGNRVPQHIQNKIVRDYCKERAMEYILAKAEYSFEKECFSQLWSCLKEETKNIVLYSMQQLPIDRDNRRKLLKYSLQEEKCLYFACEDDKVVTGVDASRVDLILSVHDSLHHDKTVNQLRKLIYSTER